MVRLTPIYPDGLTGGALLLMRLAYASLPFSLLSWFGLTAAGWWIAAIGAAIAAFALVSGTATRAAALLLATGLTWAGAGSPAEVAAILLPHAGGAVALMILGPGAFSIDARLFGRRVIRVTPRPAGGSGND